MEYLEKKKSDLVISYREIWKRVLNLSKKHEEEKLGRKLNLNEVWFEDNFLRRIARDLELLEAISINLLDSINLQKNRENKSYHKFLEPEYLAQAWYYKSFTVIKDLEHLQKNLHSPSFQSLGTISTDHAEVKNINFVRNNLIDHDINKGWPPKTTPEIWMSQIHFDTYEVTLTSVKKDTNTNFVDEGLFLNNQKFLNYLLDKFTNFSS